mmetsp:Transcript_6077/g.17064  ORF Transcript_6077/g.17064 Transcript_6077/m.17064 type:complete len:125 (+) Transcript_6077:1987-2361(+)
MKTHPTRRLVLDTKDTFCRQKDTPYAQLTTQDATSSFFRSMDENARSRRSRDDDSSDIPRWQVGRRIFDRFDLSSSSMLTTSKSGATQRTLDHIKANPYHHHENTRTQISKGQSTAIIKKSKPP